jgi:hypothetical protein
LNEEASLVEFIVGTINELQKCLRGLCPFKERATKICFRFLALSLLLTCLIFELLNWKEDTEKLLKFSDGTKL